MAFMLLEKLKKAFFSDQEAEIEKKKSSSQTSSQENVEVDYINYDPFAAYHTGITNQYNVTALKFSMLNKYITKWREISMYPEVDEAVQEIQTEAIVYDELNPPVELDLEEVELSDGVKNKVIDSFDKILYMLNFDEFGDDLFRQWYVDGQLNVECVYDNNNLKKGLQKLVLLSPYNLFKIKKEGKIFYFYNHNPSYKPEDDLKNSDRVFKQEQLVRIVSGIWSIDKKIPLSFLHKAVKPINQLALIEDALVIYRLTRAPEKRVFYIDTGRLPKTKAEEYVKNLIRKYRQKKIYNVETGDVENKSKSISILEDFWFPTTSDGKGTKVDMLQGVQSNFSDIEDIDYFLKKVYRALNVPNTRRDPENRISIGNTIDVERAEIKFFKFVLKLRKRFNNLFIELLKRDVLAQKIMRLEEWEQIKSGIQFKYANSNEYSAIKKLQVIEMKLGIAGSATSMLEEDLVSKKWIQRECMGFTEEEMDDIAKEREEEKKEAAEDEELFGGGEEDGGGTKTVRHVGKGGFAGASDAGKEGSDGKSSGSASAAEPSGSEGGKSAPQQEDAPTFKEVLIESMLDNLKNGKVVDIKGKKYKLEGDSIVEVLE